ncbi:hypothetical protein [Roseateles sp. LKC17W]|uniref:Uncharacterized protein n=1 Tax=Pelomonas margarita TaxID=3299031 RepID=A0ABW7FG75_9BURK
MHLNAVLAGATLRLGWVATALLLPAAVAMAAPPRFSGEVGASVWSSDRRLNDDKGIAVGRAKLAGEWAPSDLFSLRVEGTVMSAPERLDGDRTSTRLKELFVESRSLPCLPSLGKRFVSWGKTDALNPTDQLSPTNHRRLAAKDTEQRQGVWGLHLNCTAGPGRLQAHLLDRFRFNDVPLSRRARVEFKEDKPRLRPSAALRYETMGEAADWAVSFIDGHDLHPTLTLRSMSAQGLLIGLDATRMRMVGGDIAITHGSMVYRAEAAWVQYPNLVAGLHAQRRPYASAVVQAERGLGDRETIAIQAFAKHLRGQVEVTGHPVVDGLQIAQGLLSNELDRRQYGLTLRYARPLWESRADMDIFVVYTRPRGDWMVRGRLNHALSDSLRLSTGIDLFRGPVDSYLGNLRANSLAFVELSTAW